MTDPTSLAGLAWLFLLSILLLHSFEVELEQLLGLPLLLASVQNPLQCLLEVHCPLLLEAQCRGQLRTRGIH